MINIDYVVPMVFPQDLKWQHDYMTATGSFRNDRSMISSPRFRSWDTEELLVRCIRKNLPWIRTIYIILARPSQVQPWMEKMVALATQHTGPQVEVVFHADFMPKEVLPTYNSRAIEMYLHRIPDLAPYFLYGNDDMFPLGEMGVEEFFRPAADATDTVVEGGTQTSREVLPCLHWKMKNYNPMKAFHQACMNGMNFVAEKFDKHYDTEWIHIGHNVVPIVKATCEMFWERWPKKMQASVTRFRLPQNYNQYIYSWWQILSGQYIDHKPPRGYISTASSINDITEAIRNANGLLCINDNSEVNDITNLAATVRSEIEKRL